MPMVIAPTSTKSRTQRSLDHIELTACQQPAIGRKGCRRLEVYLAKCESSGSGGKARRMQRLLKRRSGQGQGAGGLGPAIPKPVEGRGQQSRSYRRGSRRGEQVGDIASS